MWSGIFPLLLMSNLLLGSCLMVFYYNLHTKLGQVMMMGMGIRRMRQWKTSMMMIVVQHFLLVVVVVVVGTGGV